MQKDQDKTREQLIAELGELRQQFAELKAAAAKQHRSGDKHQQERVQFRSLLDSLGDVAWAATPDGSGQLFINSACEEIYGYSANDFFQDSRL